MKQKLRFAHFTFTIILSLLISQNMALFGQCNNADFESGNFNGWTGTYGTDSCLASLFGCTCYDPAPFQFSGFLQGPVNTPANYASAQYCQVLNNVPAGNDPVLSANGITLPVIWPGGGTYSARIGSTWPFTNYNNPDAASMSYKFLVTPSNCNFIYHYAVVFSSGNGHTAAEQPYFEVRMYTQAGDTITSGCFDANATSAETQTGFDSTGNGGSIEGEIYYKKWSSVFVPLGNYVGDSVIISFITRCCDPYNLFEMRECSANHFAYAYIDAECSGPLAITTTGIGGCSTDSVTLTAPSGFAGYSWTGPGIVTPTNTLSVIVTQPGHYSVSINISLSSCDTTSVLKIDTLITFSAAGNLKANFSVSSACTGISTFFTDLSISSGQISSWAWDFDNDGLTDSTSENPSYIFAASGTHNVKLTVTSGFCYADTVIPVLVSATPVLIHSTDTAICVGEKAELTVSGAGNYLWKPSASLNSTTDSNIIASPGITTTYTVTGNSYTCSATDSIKVTVNPVPVVNLGKDTSTCDTQAIVLNAGNSGAKFSWSNDSTTQTISVTTSGNYSVTVNTDSGCCAKDTISVVYGSLPRVTIQATKLTICPGDSSHICAPSGFITYNWNTGDTGICLYVSNPGNYYLTVTNNAGCQAGSNLLTVSVFMSPPVSTSESNDTFTAYNAVAYQWYFNGLPITNDTSATCIAKMAGSYIVQITDSNGCTEFSNPQFFADIKSILNNAFEIYPNPLGLGNWQMNVGQAFIGAALQIYDDNGRLVYKEIIHSLHSEIELNVASGIYQAALYSPYGWQIKKLVKL